MIIRFCIWLDSKIFPRETMQEKVAKELQKEIIEIEQARTAINAHKFQEHMSIAKIKALNSWLMMPKEPITYFHATTFKENKHDSFN